MSQKTTFEFILQPFAPYTVQIERTATVRRVFSYTTGANPTAVDIATGLAASLATLVKTDYTALAKCGLSAAVVGDTLEVTGRSFQIQVGSNINAYTQRPA